MATQFSIVFPGQGSQSLGMLAGLSERPEIKTTFDEASSLLGFDLWRLCQQGPEAELNQTQNTQPAMLAAGVGIWRLWLANGGQMPTLLAGHSLGEYTALVAAEALAFGDALRLVRERGRLMQDAVPEKTGAMAAILGLEDGQVRELCAQAAAGQVCEAANFNSPGQVVAAGHAQAIERLLPLAKAAGAKRALLLAVSVPSHSSLMRPAAGHLAEILARTPINPPRIPLIHNVNLESAPEPDAIRRLLVEQLYCPVRWTETIALMKTKGLELVLELGPGKVLTGLGKRIDKSLNCLAVQDMAGLETAIAACA